MLMISSESQVLKVCWSVSCFTLRLHPLLRSFCLWLQNCFPLLSGSGLQANCFSYLKKKTLWTSEIDCLIHNSCFEVLKMFCLHTKPLFSDIQLVKTSCVLMFSTVPFLQNMWLHALEMKTLTVMQHSPSTTIWVTTSPSPSSCVHGGMMGSSWR